MINFVKVTVGKTIIGTPEMQNYLGAINIINIASCKVIALTTITIAIVVIPSRS